MTVPDRAGVEDVRAFVEAWQANGDTNEIAWARTHQGEFPLTVTSLLAVLAENARLHDEADLLREELLKAFGACDGCRRRLVEAERALMLLLLREENATVEFTPAEMTRAPGNGSFVSSRNVATSGEQLAFVAAKGGVKQ